MSVPSALLTGGVQNAAINAIVSTVFSVQATANATMNYLVDVSPQHKLDFGPVKTAPIV